MDWGTPAQQRRGIVLHRPARHELLQLLGRRPGSGRRLPAQVISDGQQMVGTSLLTCPVAGQHTGLRDPIASFWAAGMTLPCRGCATDKQLRVSRPAHCHRHERESH
jgi:hypothetical protein